uniref:Uncharacterized protein n=1 Tax=Rhizophora mucronata TaxID=61149 RepID=A0A2P2J3Q1_RHIMU
MSIFCLNLQHWLSTDGASMERF